MAKYKVIFVVVAIALFIGLPLTTYAQYEPEENVFIAQDVTIPVNFFRTGDTIDISGTLEKDAYVAGNIVTVDGTIKGDLIGVANTLNLNGTVEGNVRFAAQSIIINGTVGRNVTVAANSVTIGPDAVVNWELLSAGNIITIDGVVESNVNVAGAALNIGGEVKGRVDAQLDGGRLELRDGANVHGDIEYVSATEIDQAPSAQVGGVITRNEPASSGSKQIEYGAMIWGLIMSFLSSLLIAAILIWIAPKFVRYVADQIKKQPGMNFLWGLIFIIMTPIVAIIVMITFIGFPLAIIGFVLYLIMLYIAKVFFAVALVEWLGKLFNMTLSKKLIVLVPIGLAIYILVTAIPILGWILGFVAVCISVGAMLQSKVAIINKDWR